MKILIILALLLSAGAATGWTQVTGTVAFSQSQYSADDTDGTTDIDVLMSGAPDGIAGISYTVTGAIATNGTLSFPVGTLTNTLTLNVPANLTSNLLAQLTLHTPTGNAATGALTAATLTIVASDPPPSLTGTHVFPIGIAAVLATNDGSRIACKAPALVGAGNRLVLVVNIDDHEVHLGSSDPDLNVTLIASSTSCAFLGNGVFGANLVFNSIAVSNHYVNLTGTGDVQIRGTLYPDPATDTTRFLGGQLMGVFNDSVNGNTADGDALLKAKLTPAGRELNIDDVTFEN